MLHDNNRNIWQIRNVSDDARRTVRIYAAEREMRYSQALEELIIAGYQKLSLRNTMTDADKNSSEDQSTTTTADV